MPAGRLAPTGGRAPQMWSNPGRRLILQTTCCTSANDTLLISASTAPAPTLRSQDRQSPTPDGPPQPDFPRPMNRYAASRSLPCLAELLDTAPISAALRLRNPAAKRMKASTSAKLETIPNDTRTALTVLP